MSELFTLLTKVLRVFFRLIGHIQSVWFLKRTLFVWVHIDVALLALLTRVSPGVARHPFTLTFGTLVLSEATFLSLVGSQTLSTRASLK